MKRFSIVLLIMTLLLKVILGGGIVLAQDIEDNPYLVETITAANGKQIDRIAVPGYFSDVKQAAAAVPKPNPAAGTNSLANVPAFDWSFGCSATSAAMMFGYYDNTDYSNMYAGPTNGDVCPMDNSSWPDWWDGSANRHQMPLSATHNGLDGRTMDGHVDDYWISYGSPGPDPYVTDGRPEHVHGDCTGDFMGTNQWAFGNTDGMTTFWFYSDGSPFGITDVITWLNPATQRDGGHGLQLFAESRGYTVTNCYNQYILGWNGNTLGFTFAQYKAEIDAGRPVLIHTQGHTMLGYGYNDDMGQKVYIHDTWDYLDHEMDWGGMYNGAWHFGVTILMLDPVGNNPPVADAGPDQSAYVGDSLTLDGSSSSDPDGSIVSYDWDFGDGESGSGVTVSHAYSEAGTYTVTLTVTDNGGAMSEDMAIVTISEAPAAPIAWVNIDLSEQSVRTYWRVIATVTITENDASGPAIAGATVYGSWSGAYSRTVSGTTDSGGEVSFGTSFIRESGIVTFTITNIVKNGQEYILSGETSDSTGEPVDNPPTVSITSPPDGATVSGVVTIGADASDDAGVAQVDFYYGATLIGTDNTAPYSVDWDSAAVGDGVYTLTCTAIDTASQEASDSINVTVDNDNPPTVSITSPPDGATVSGVVTIGADASDDVGVAQVDFYYGATLIGTDNTAPYSVDWNSTAVGDGVYTLTCTAIDTASQEASDSINVTVDNVNYPPVVNAGPDQTVSDADGTGVETVILDGSGSYDPDGSIASYNWTEGGALLGTGEMISCDFAVGTHNITLTVTDDEGASAGDECIIDVVANQAPVADAGPDQSAYVGDSLTFDGSGSSDPDGSIVSYDWDFGDETSGSGVTVSHAYSEAGNYTVTLTVTDNGGSVSEDMAIVTISEAPAAPIAWVNIDLSEQSVRTYWRVIATVTITENDASGPAIAGATVYGSWSGDYSRTVSGTTDSGGEVSFGTSFIRESGTVTFTVTRIVKNGQEYILSGETSDSTGRGS